jgi:hypothetical protein
MLAVDVSPWYQSATFWSGAGVAVAAFTLLISVGLWFIGSPRRLLIYGVRSQTALLTSNMEARAQVGPELQVTLDGRFVADPHVVSIVVVNRSRRDIRNADFEESEPFALDLNVPILKTLGSDSGGSAMPEIRHSLDGSKLTIGPCRIQRRQVLCFDLLTDGPAELSYGNPSLADITVRDGTDDDVEPLWLIRLGTVAGLAFFASIAVSAFWTGKWASGLHDVLFYGSVFSLVSAAVIAMTVLAYRQGGLSRVRPWTRRVE